MNLKMDGPVCAEAQRGFHFGVGPWPRPGRALPDDQIVRIMNTLNGSST
jgi:hypothetical protein